VELLGGFVAGDGHRGGESPLLSPPGFRVGLFWFRIQLISQATGVWVHLHAEAYSAGVR
jgi:hypothetical protein